MKSKLFAFGLFFGVLVSPWTGLDAIWQPAETISDPAIDVGSLGGDALAVNFQGNAIVVFTYTESPYGESDAAIASAFYTRGVGWAPFEWVSSFPLSSNDEAAYGALGDPDVDMNSSNYAVAVWEGSYDDIPFPGLSVFASVRPPGGPWGPVYILSSQYDLNSDNENVAVQVNEAGTALAAWRRHDIEGNYDETMVSFLPLGGIWTTPFAISTQETSTGNRPYPRIALNSRGDAVVIWQKRLPGNIYGIEVATYNAATATWNPPVTLDFAGGGAISDYPVVSMDENGNAVAIWVNGTLLRVSSYTFGDIWEPGIVLSTSASFDSPYVIMDRAGNATAVWTELSGLILSASKPLGGVWSAPVIINPGFLGAIDGFQVQDPVAVDLAGNVIAVWEVGNESVMSAFKPFGQAWQAPELVSNTNDLQYPNVGLAECGFAVSSWQDDDGNNAVVRAAVNENVFPLIVAGSARYTQCTQKFATQKRVVSSLTWESLYPECVAAFNIYCNGELVGTSTDGRLAATVADCDNSCRFTLTAVNFQGFESDPIPFVLRN